MVFYCTLYLFVFYLYLYSTKKKRLKLLYLLELIVLTIILAFRENGVDYISYKMNFLNGYNYMDIGFNYLNKILYVNRYSFQVLIIISAIISLFFLLEGLKNFQMNSSQKMTFIFIFVLTSSFFMYMNIFKQSMAISIFFYSLNFLILGNYLKYIALILSAYLFHSSVILLLPLYFIKKIVINIYCKLAIIIFLLINTQINILKNLLILVISKINLNYVNYLSQDGFGETYSKIGILLIIKIFILFYFNYIQNKNYFKIKSKYFNKKNREIILNIYFIGVVFDLLKSDIYILYRMADYFSVVLCLILYIIFENKFNNTLNKVTKIILIIFFTVLFIKNIVEDHYGIVPYRCNFKINR